MRTLVTNKQFDEERALYHLQNADIKNCTFAGPHDGESVLKEARDIQINNCSFSLRYPIWHTKGFAIRDSRMDELTRAALWYAEDGVIEDSTLNGIKVVRECHNIQIVRSKVRSEEFGWKSSNVQIADSQIESEYFLFDSRNITLERVKMSGKYSFQYIDGLEISDCELNTKDAFWHSKNVTVRNSVIKGEYLGWYSDGLTLESCNIIGTQPLCYCKNLRLINCTMENTDLAFEYSDVTADISGHVISIKNPKSGIITADSVGTVIRDHTVTDCAGEVVIRAKTSKKSA